MCPAGPIRQNLIPNLWMGMSNRALWTELTFWHEHLYEWDGEARHLLHLQSRPLEDPGMGTATLEL